MRIDIVLLSCWMVLGVTTSQPAGHTYALVVSGIGKDPNERLAREQVVTGLRAYLQDRAAVDPNRLAVLLAHGPSLGHPGSMSSADNVEKVMQTLARAVRPADRLVFYYTGQANAVAGPTRSGAPDTLRFNLPGPDITPADLTAWLGELKARTQLVILDCPCAALGAKVLAGPGRIILCASAQEQVYATRFGAHFVPALTRAQTDTNHDGGISVLEAFTTAVREIEQWYQQRQLLLTETPCLEDNGDGTPSPRPWRYELDGGDGRRAAELVLARSP